MITHWFNTLWVYMTTPIHIASALVIAGVVTLIVELVGWVQNKRGR